MSDQSESIEYTNLPTSRIEGLSDAVFAIVMTLLVLELKIPEVPKEAGKVEFLKSFIPLWESFFHYVLSFVILGVYWVGHHKQFHYIQRSDRILLWLNILFLMLVALIPFATALLGTYPDRAMPVALYSANMFFIASLLYAKWDYATHNHRLVRDNLSHKIILRGKTTIFTGIVIYLIAIALSLYSIKMSIFLLILVPIIYITPNDREYYVNLWKRLRKQKEF